MLSINEYLSAGMTSVSNLLLETYHQIGLTDEEFLFWLQLYKAQAKGNSFPDLSVIAQQMGKSSETIYMLLSRLVEKQMIAIQTKQNEQQQMMDTYDLFPIFEKVAQLLQKKDQQNQQQATQLSIKQLYQSFEKEFGRPLSPMELEMIGQWLEVDHYAIELILLALREAILNQVYSLKYIDRILLSWERKHVTTKEQVAKEQQRRKQVLLQKELAQEEPLPSAPQITFHNWLHPEDTE